VSVRERMTLAAAAAVLLGGTALLPLFEDRTWMWRAAGAVLTVALVGLVCRRFAVPVVLQPLLGLTGLGLYLGEAFVRGSLKLGLVPTGRTVDAVSALVTAGRMDIAKYGPPVPVNPGLALLAAAGLGAAAVVVDLLAVLLERSAVAGLPLLALQAVPSAVLPDGLGWLPFALGAAGWLGLLLLEGRARVGRWGAASGGLARGQDSSLGRVGRRIGAAALGMAVVVPALLPGLHGQLLAGSGIGEGGSGTGRSRSTTTYNPITRLGIDLREPTPRQLLTYTTTDPQPDYLRLTTLDLFDGTSWQSSKLSADRDRDRVQNGIPRPADESAPRQDLSMRVTINGLDVRWLPVPFGPTDVQVKGTWLYDARSTTVFSTERDTTAIKPYAVRASRVLPDRQLLQAAGSTVEPAIAERYGQPLTVTPYVQKLTTAVVRDATTSYDKAVTLQKFFRSAEQNFVYDLSASTPAPGGDQLEAFLRGRHGFCEQYATAMAVMLRVAGVPSRVAVGFTPGEILQGNTHSVTTSDAHAWPEAWFAGAGWVRFEPTPPQSTAVVPGYSVPAVGSLPGGGTAQPSAAPAPKDSAPGRKLPNPVENLPGATPAGGRSAGGGTPLLPLVLMAAVLLLGAPALLRVVRRRRWAAPDGGGGALTAWSQLQDDAADTGHRWRPAQSPRAAAQRLRAERRFDGPVAAALERLAVAAERARYAPAGGGTTDPGALRADVALLRTALIDGVPTGIRWRARLAPPSTLTWLRAGVSERLAAATQRVDGLLTSIGRLPRRWPGST